MRSKKDTLRWRISQWAEIRWWKRYLKNLSPKEYIKKKKAYWHGLLDALEISFPQNKRILDAGCGPAGIFIILEGNMVTAIDPLINAYTSLDHFNTQDYPWVNFMEIAVEDFDDTPFPLVFCFNAINHVSNWDLALNRLTALTESGGMLVLSSDVHNHHWLKKVFRSLPGDILHPHQHSMADYRQALNARGWQIIREKTLKKGRIFDYWAVIARKK